MQWQERCGREGRGTITVIGLLLLLCCTVSFSSAQNSTELVPPDFYDPITPGKALSCPMTFISGLKLRGTGLFLFVF